MAQREDEYGGYVGYSGTVVFFIDVDAGEDDDLVIASPKGGLNGIYYGGLGDDAMYGSYATDNLFGEDGNDTLLGYDGDDELYGGNGNDFLDGGESFYGDRLYGGNDDDILWVAEPSQGYGGVPYVGNELYGEGGDDELYGGDWADKLYGGAGGDWIDGGGHAEDVFDATDEGQNWVADDNFYGDGYGTLLFNLTDQQESVALGYQFVNDVALLTLNASIFTVSGKSIPAADVFFALIDARGGNDVINLSGMTSNGFTHIWGAGQGLQVRGGSGDDQLLSSPIGSILYGDDGEDTLIGNAGVDHLQGGNNNDTITGEGSTDFIYGGSGNDVLSGGTGDDDIYGQAGDDIIHGNAGDDELFGDSGSDLVYGDEDDDELWDPDGNTGLDGGPGDDLINGNPG